MTPTNQLLPQYITYTDLDPSFDREIRDVHLLYDYNAQDKSGKPERWRYEMWFFSDSRIVYAIRGGPMAGRVSYQKATYQCVRPGEVWQVNWLEETGTVCSLVYDISRSRITTLVSLSKGHWEQTEQARGDKRNAKDFERCRQLSKMGNQTERVMLSVQADIIERFKGGGDLLAISEDAPTL